MKASLTLILLLAAQSAPATEPSRGELLYANHCGSCHGEQVHWREKRLVSDWASLKAQVARWQDAAQLGWTRDDVAAVARHLNRQYYRYPQPD